MRDRPSHSAGSKAAASRAAAGLRIRRALAFALAAAAGVARPGQPSNDSRRERPAGRREAWLQAANGQEPGDRGPFGNLDVEARHFGILKAADSARHRVTLLLDGDTQPRNGPSPPAPSCFAPAGGGGLTSSRPGIASGPGSKRTAREAAGRRVAPGRRAESTRVDTRVPPLPGPSLRLRV